METIQLTFTFNGAASPKDIATKLRWQAGLLEGLDKKEAASIDNTSGKLEKKAKASKAAPAPVIEDDVEDDDDFTPASAKPAAASFDDDEEVTGVGSDVPPADEDEEADFTTPPKKAAKAPKAKKLTANDVNDACKKRAARVGGKAGRDEVLGILQKKFKTTSVSELKPEQYASAIEAMA